MSEKRVVLAPSISKVDAQLVKLLNPRGENGFGQDPLGIGSLIGHCWPANRQLDLPIVSDFLSFYSSPDHLPREPWILARDGLLPLFLFFQNCPDPGGFQGKILLPVRLKSLIPPAWKDQAMVYRYENIGENEIETQTLVLCGLNYELTGSLEQLRSQLASIKSARDARIVKCLLVPKSGGWGLDYFSSFSSEFVLEVLNCFRGAKFEWLGYDAFECLRPKKGERFVEFNQMTLISDSFLSSSLFSRGFKVLETDSFPPESIELTIPVSPYHALVVAKPGTVHAPSREELQNQLIDLFARLPALSQFYKRALLMKEC